MTRLAWTAVNLAAVRANARGIVRACPGCVLIAVVKRDAYGHGAVAVARCLRGMAGMLAVADAGEAADLRRAGIGMPVLLLGPAATTDPRELLRLRVTPSLTDARDMTRMPRPEGGMLEAHLKFDTGMGRLGFDPVRAGEVARVLGRRGVRRLAGTWTHLSAPGERAFTELQLRRFDACLRALRAAGIDPGLTHAAGSGGILASPRSRGYGAVRAGLLLYGCVPDGMRRPGWARPAMSFHTRVAAVRRVPRGAAVSYGHTWRAPRMSALAVLPAGYADGFGRGQSNAGCVLIHGRRAPVRGTVCMNHVIVDVTGIPGVRPGDEAVFFGRQRGARLTAEEAARTQGTISYEVLCAAGRMNVRRGGSCRG